MKNLLSCGILFFFLPVLLVVFFHGGTAVWGDSQASDTALMVLLYQNSPQNEELEALKAEAVVFRTILNRYSAKEWHSLLQASVEAGQEKAYIEKKSLYAQAIQDTANVQIKGNTHDHLNTLSLIYKGIQMTYICHITESVQGEQETARCYSWKIIQIIRQMIR